MNLNAPKLVFLQIKIQNSKVKFFDLTLKLCQNCGTNGQIFTFFYFFLTSQKKLALVMSNKSNKR